MTYQAAHVNQLHDAHGKPWGTPFDGGNCWAAAGSMAADFATLGKWTPIPSKIRQLSGNTLFSGTVQDIATALRTNGITVQVPNGGASWNAIQAKLATGKWAVCIALDYDQIPAASSCQPGFTGDHMEFLQLPIGPAGNQPGDDPLCNNSRTYNPDDIRAAARKCANRIGTHGLIVAFVKQNQPAVPPPPPSPDPKDKQIADLTAQLADANDTIASLQDQIAAAVAALA